MNEFQKKRLQAKESELIKLQENFEIFWSNEKNSDCFERNAINELLIMMQLKDEIREIKYEMQFII